VWTPIIMERLYPIEDTKYSADFSSMSPFIYKDFPFGRLVFKCKEAGAVIIVTDNNSVMAARFSRDNMRHGVKYAFRPKFTN